MHDCAPVLMCMIFHGKYTCMVFKCRKCNAVLSVMDLELNYHYENVCRETGACCSTGNMQGVSPL